MTFDPKKRAPQQSPDFPDSFHRVTIKGLYVKDGKVLLSHDFVNPERPVWELPGGGLDFGESPREGLKREIKEEMGLEVTSISEKPMYIWTARREKSRGLDWWYALLIAYRIDIRDLHELKITDECRAVKFFSKSELQKAKDLNEPMRPLATLFNPQDFE